MNVFTQVVTRLKATVKLTLKGLTRCLRDVIYNRRLFKFAGKKSTSKLNPEKQPDIVNNIESRVVQLNEKLSDLKTWNISQLNQVWDH